MKRLIRCKNTGNTPIIVGDTYLYPGQTVAVPEHVFNAAKSTHPQLVDTAAKAEKKQIITKERPADDSIAGNPAKPARTRRTRQKRGTE